MMHRPADSAYTQEQQTLGFGQLLAFIAGGADLRGNRIKIIFRQADQLVPVCCSLAEMRFRVLSGLAMGGIGFSDGVFNASSGLV